MLGTCRGHTWRSGMGRGTISKVWDGSRGPPEGPGGDWEVLWKVPEGSGDPTKGPGSVGESPGGYGRVGGPTGKSGTNRRTPSRVLDGLGTLPEF